MEYTVNKLARLSGVTERTLRYYDKIGLLHPCRMNSNGYRIYGKKELYKLQQILFYKELALPLEKIKNLLDGSGNDESCILKEQFTLLKKKREHLDSLLKLIEKTLKEKKGEIKMTDTEKFEAFKQQQLKENDERYEKELKELYDEETIRKSNDKFERLTEDQMEEMQSTAKQILVDLKEAKETKNPAGKKAQQLAQLHREWLDYTWPEYTKTAHRGLADLYVSDPRFIQYYDEVAGEGAAEFFRKAIYVYTEK